MIIPPYNRVLGMKVDRRVKNLKFRHACEGRHPELFEKLDSRLRGMTPRGILRLFTKPSKLNY